MTDPVGYVTAQAHAEFGGYFPLEAIGLVTTSTGPEIKPPQSNMEYCTMKSTMPYESWVAYNSIIEKKQSSCELWVFFSQQHTYGFHSSGKWCCISRQFDPHFEAKYCPHLNVHKDISGTYQQVKMMKLYGLETLWSDYPLTQYLIQEKWNPQRNCLSCHKHLY